MFGEPPSPEVRASVPSDMLEASQGAHRRVEAPAGPELSAMAVNKLRTGGGPRVALWFINQPDRSGQDTFRRVVEDKEESWSRILMSKIRRRKQSAQASSDAASRASSDVMELYRAFCCDIRSHGVEREAIRTIRCLPLDGDLARLLPPELVGSSSVSVVHLPAPPAGRSGGAVLAAAGVALKRARGIVEELLKESGPTVFKIGITCNPLIRWRAYERDGYAKMHLL